MATEQLTFANYNVYDHGPDGVMQIGATAEHPGVAQEIATAFDHELSPWDTVANLGDLIAKVGPAKTLQDNIGRVQETLGTSADAVEITRGWAERSGLLVPVERTYMTGEPLRVDPDSSHVAVMTGGVPNWMERRANRVIEFAKKHRVDTAVLVAGERQLGRGGMTEAEYMESVIAPRLGEAGLETQVVQASTEKGDEVMSIGAAHVASSVDLRRQRVSLISNAGAWPQNGGQFYRALRERNPRFNLSGSQLGVASDSFLLGTGTEPTITHQNPFSAVGQIVRNLQEVFRNAVG
jgi:hypothetical protein